MARRLTHLIGFIVSAIAIFAYAFALMIATDTTPVPQREGMLIADPSFFSGLVWVGSIAGFVCAAIVATRTAWSFYSHGKLASWLNRKVA